MGSNYYYFQEIFGDIVNTDQSEAICDIGQNLVLESDAPTEDDATENNQSEVNSLEKRVILDDEETDIIAVDDINNDKHESQKPSRIKHVQNSMKDKEKTSTKSDDDDEELRILDRFQDTTNSKVGGSQLRQLLLYSGDPNLNFITR